MKEKYADYRVDVNASAAKVFSLLTDVRNWKNWTGVKISHVLSSGGFQPGALMMFVPSIANLPGPPLVCRIYACEENRLIQWGIRVGSSEIIHQFTIEETAENACSVHQEEWASGAMYLATKPIGRMIGEFDQRLGDDLVAYFA